MRRTAPRAFGVVLFSATLILCSLAGAPRAASQDLDVVDEPLDVQSTSVFVPADGTFEVSFSTDSLAIDDIVRFSIHEPFVGAPSDVAESLTELRLGGSLPPALHGSQELPLGELISSPGIATLSVPVRTESNEDSDRLYLPNPGPHPIQVTVVSSAGEVKHRSVLLVNHLPPPTAESNGEPFPVSLFTLTSSEPIFDAQGIPNLQGNPETVGEWLSSLNGVIPSESLNIFIDPQLLDGFAFGDEELQPTLDAMRETLKDQFTLAGPWAPLHTEAWAQTGSTADIGAAVVAGTATISVQGGTDPITSVWPLDPYVGGEAPAVLERAGMDYLLVAPYQLPDTESESEPTPVNRLLNINVDNQTRLSGLLTDDVSALVLRDVNRQPAVVANGIGAQIVASAIDAPQGALAIEVTRQTPLETLAALASGFSATTNKSVALNDLRSTFEQVTASDDNPIDITLLAANELPDLSTIASRTSELRTKVGALGVMLPRGDPLANQLSVSLSESSHRDLSVTEMHTRLDELETRADGAFDSVEIVTRPITLAAREADIPLRISNGLDRPITVILSFDSPRLEFVDGGTQRVELAPGENRLEVPVIVRAGGEFQMNVEVLSPDEQLVVTEAKYFIRAQIFSGIGFILAGGALVVLVTWWMRTGKLKEPKEATANDELDGSVA